ncbi:trihelix transcription factor PTL-like [Hibiscus syriacus]|uniref:trihelix transcription factor PTL-like n=1 Tax=Hibiscus syriacus TaxID=106335 RepID=UPI001922F7CB|nr:trihelix transcription factor PTL-like [Hibiscus syriacus]
MEDHHHHHQYGMPDELLSGRTTNFQAILLPQIPPQFCSSSHRDLPPPQQSHHHYHFDTMPTVGTQIGADQLMCSGLHQEFPSDSTANNVIATVTSTPSASCGFDGEKTGRWPRQEALTLVEIRSRLHPMFKEANQKGPLWDEVSRIMYEEYGYRRSEETCKEKFENLFKYYKRTREVKAGRHDGKHHRFFRHLEALYGDTSSFSFHNTLNSHSQANHELSHSDGKHCDSFSLSNSSGFDTYNSDDNDLITAEALKRKRKKGSSARWKVKIEEFMDSQMKKLMERQEAWIEKLMKTLEQKEKERVSREEEWRKENAARLDREHRFWAKERAWIEARDAALIKALQNLTGKKFKGDDLIATESVKEDGWQESEVSWLIQLRTCMESRFEEEEGCSEEILWEEIAAKMTSLGFERSALMCKHKWKSIGACLMKTEGNIKRKSTRCSDYDYRNNVSLYSEGEYCETNLWETHGLKLSKSKNQ